MAGGLLGGGGGWRSVREGEVAGGLVGRQEVAGGLLGRGRWLEVC